MRAFGQPEIDLDFRPKGYSAGPREIDYPILGHWPGFGGGSYLPRLGTGEVEIAGVALDSSTGDVISIRAQRVPNGIRFRIVDEYRSSFKIRNPIRDGPMSLRELVELMDTAEHGGMVGLVEAYLDLNWDGLGRQGDPAELQHFARVLSPFYPGLVMVYENRVEEWVSRMLTQPRGDADAGQQTPDL